MPSPFSSKYREFPDLPIWMLTEVLSFDLPPHPTWQEPCLTTNQRPYVTLLMLAHVVSRIAVQRDFMRHWKREVIELLTRIPEAPAAADRLVVMSGRRTRPRSSERGLGVSGNARAGGIAIRES